MNPEQDVLENLAEHVSTTIIGHGAVNLALKLYRLANIDEDCEEDPDLSYHAPYNRFVDHVARVMLRNATSGHANQLRIGPYRSSAHENERTSIVQKMVSPANLELAKRMFDTGVSEVSLS